MNHKFKIGYRDRNTNGIHQLETHGDFTLEEIRAAAIGETGSKSVVILVPETMKPQEELEVA